LLHAAAQHPVCSNGQHHNLLALKGRLTSSDGQRPSWTSIKSPTKAAARRPVCSDGQRPSWERPKISPYPQRHALYITLVIIRPGIGHIFFRQHLYFCILGLVQKSLNPMNARV
jgi:hypothetical protein